MDERAEFYVREARRLREVAASFVCGDTRQEIFNLALHYEALAQRLGAVISPARATESQDA